MKGWEVKKRQCWRGVPRGARKAQGGMGKSKVQSHDAEEAEFEDLRFFNQIQMTNS